MAFPVIGAGSGGFDETQALALMIEAFQPISSDAQVVIVRYRVSNREDPLQVSGHIVNTRPSGTKGATPPR